MLRLMICSLSTFAFNGLLYAFWAGSHDTAFHPGGLPIPWWLFLGCLFFGYLWMKTKGLKG